MTFGPSSPLSSGKLEAGGVASERLVLEGTRLEGTATALLTSSLRARGLALEIETADGWKRLGSRPVELAIEEQGRRRWPLRLRVGSCAPDVPAEASHEILVEAPELEEPTVRLRVPVEVTVIETPGLICWWPVLASILGGVVVLGIIYGFVSPARFRPRLGVVLSPEEDMSEGFFHPIRQTRGSGAGFYRDARIHVPRPFG